MCSPGAVYKGDIKLSLDHPGSSMHFRTCHADLFWGGWVLQVAFMSQVC
jgi:hypothetical protein